MSGKDTLSQTQPIGEPPGESLVIIEYKYHHGLKEKRKRTKFSAQSQEILEKYYLKNPLPNTLERTTLSTQLGLSTRCIQVWFQNRRVKERRVIERCSSPSSSSSSSKSISDSPSPTPNSLSGDSPALSPCSSYSVSSPPSSSPSASSASTSIAASHSAPFLSPSLSSCEPDTKVLACQSEGSFPHSRLPPTFSSFESLAWSRRGSLYGFDELSLRFGSPHQPREDMETHENVSSPPWNRATRSFCLGSSAPLETRTRIPGALPRLSSFDSVEQPFFEVTHNTLPSISALMKRKKEDRPLESFVLPRPRSASFSLPEASAQTYVRSHSVCLPSPSPSPSPSFSSKRLKEPNPFADFGNYHAGIVSTPPLSPSPAVTPHTDVCENQNGCSLTPKRKSSIFDLLSSSSESVPSSSSPGYSCLTSTSTSTSSSSSLPGSRGALLPPLSTLSSGPLPPLTSLSTGSNSYLRHPC